MTGALVEENEALKLEVQRLRAQLLQKAELATCQELQKSGPKAAALQGANHKEIQQLLQKMEKIVRDVQALPMGLSAAEAVAQRKEVRCRAAPMFERGEGSDETAVRLMREDLKPERPLESLQSLRQTKPPNGDTQSGVGKVIDKMTEEVGKIIDKFGGDGPVPYAKEDRMIQDLIKKFMFEVLVDLQKEQEGAALLGKNLDEQEEKLVNDITAMSKELLERGTGRGEKELKRNLTVKALLEYHVKRVGIANSQNRPMEILQAKLAEFDCEVEQDAEAYKSLQQFHLDSAKTLREKKQLLEELVCEAEEDSRQEEQRENLKAGVEALGRKLQEVLEEAHALSEVCAFLDGKQLAYEEAKKVKEEQLPGLEQAEEIHMEAHGRVARGANLLADVAGCIKAAYGGLMEHSREYMEECERKAPAYGAKCMAVQQSLHRTINQQMEKLEAMLNKKYDERARLDNELEMAEMDLDREPFEAAKLKWEACACACENFEAQIEQLEEVRVSTSPEVLRPAQEAAALADPAIQEGAQEWVKRFFFEPPKRSTFGRLPALTEGAQVRLGAPCGLQPLEDRRDFRLQLEDDRGVFRPSGKAPTLEEDAVSVQSSCDYVLIEDTPLGAAKAAGGFLSQPAGQSFSSPVAASSEAAVPRPQELPTARGEAALEEPQEPPVTTAEAPAVELSQAAVEEPQEPPVTAAEAPAVELSQAAVEEPQEPPVTAAEDVLHEAFFVGKWKTAGGDIAQVSQDAIAWPDGSFYPVKMETATTFMATTIEGISYRAELRHGQLEWSDGDLWNKVEEA